MGLVILMSFGDIKGDSKEAQHQGWVKLKSCNFDISRSAAQETGNPKRNIATPSLSPFRITKSMDIATPRLFTESVIGTGQECTIHFANSGDGSKFNVFLEYKLTNAVISYYAVDGTSHVEQGASLPNESIQISYTSIQSIFTPYDEKNAAGSPYSAGYDISQAKKL